MCPRAGYWSVPVVQPSKSSLKQDQRTCKVLWPAAACGVKLKHAEAFLCVKTCTCVELWLILLFTFSSQSTHLPHGYTINEFIPYMPSISPLLTCRADFIHHITDHVVRSRFPQLLLAREELKQRKYAEMSPSTVAVWLCDVDSGLHFLFW